MSLSPILLKVLFLFFLSQPAEVLFQFLGKVWTWVGGENAFSHGSYFHGIPVKVLIMNFDAFLPEELQVALDIFGALSLIVARFLTPMRNSSFSTFLSFPDLLSRQGGLLGFPGFGFSSGHWVPGGLLCCIFPKGGNYPFFKGRDLQSG